MFFFIQVMFGLRRTWATYTIIYSIAVTLITNLTNVMANFAGVASSLELFHISRYVSVPVSARWGAILVSGASVPTSTPAPTNTPLPPTATFTPIPPTATPTSSGSVTVTFTEVGYVTSFGQNIFIVGNVPELGNLPSGLDRHAAERMLDYMALKPGMIADVTFGP